jgi:hypothetical protein
MKTIKMKIEIGNLYRLATGEIGLCFGKAQKEDVDKHLSELAVYNTIASAFGIAGIKPTHMMVPSGFYKNKYLFFIDNKKVVVGEGDVVERIYR